MDLPPTVGQKIKNLSNPIHRQVLSLMLKKNYDNASSQNEVIAKNISAFRKSSKKNSESKMAAVRRSLCLMLTIFTKKQLLILQILSSCQNILHNSYKEGYIQSKVGSHIITGVP